MAINYKALGKRIKTIRKRKGMTQSRLAELIHYSTPYISYLETGKKHMSVDVLILIANELNVSADELLIDSLENTIVVSNHEFANLLADCSDYEMRVFLDLLRATKESMRRNKRMRNH